jgi:hypothetical protein
MGATKTHVRGHHQSLDGILDPVFTRPAHIVSATEHEGRGHMGSIGLKPARTDERSRIRKIAFNRREIWPSAPKDEGQRELPFAFALATKTDLDWVKRLGQSEGCDARVSLLWSRYAGQMAQRGNLGDGEVSGVAFFVSTFSRDHDRLLLLVVHVNWQKGASLLVG